MGNSAGTNFTPKRIGRKFEIACLGYCPPDGPPARYQEFEPSKWWAIYHQPEDYDPRHPTGGLNDELYDRVYGFLPRRWRHFLNLYIAVGTSFDQWHGIDAFFFLNDAIVTIDVTTDLFKRSFKADFLVTEKEMDPVEGRVSDALASKIANLLIRRCQQRRAK